MAWLVFVGARPFPTLVVTHRGGPHIKGQKSAIFGVILGFFVVFTLKALREREKKVGVGYL